MGAAAVRRATKARELVEQRLNVESQRFAAAERQPHQAECALTDLEHTAVEVRHLLGALRDFSLVREPMTTPNCGWLLRTRITQRLDLTFFVSDV